MIPGRRRQSVAFPFASALIALTVAACAPVVSSRADADVPTELRPVVSCDGGECAVRIQVTSSGRLLSSEPLPFSASSGELERVDADESLGNSVLDQPARPLSAWTIGLEEHGITVGVEILQALPGRYALLVHQVGGYEHVKRAHVVLDVGPEALVTVEEFIEGPGPGTISVAAEPGGLVVLRVRADGGRSTERRHWHAGGAALELRPMQ